MAGRGACAAAGPAAGAIFPVPGHSAEGVVAMRRAAMIAALGALLGLLDAD